MNAVVEAARAWIGTPYRHQASCRGAGCDCLGLLRGVWRDCLGDEPVTIPPYSQDWSEPTGVEELWRAAESLLISKPVDKPEAADVLLFRMRSASVAKHLGIQSMTADVPRFIHSYSGHGVVESVLTTAWQRRLVARFRFPERM